MRIAREMFVGALRQAAIAGVLVGIFNEMFKGMSRGPGGLGCLRGCPGGWSRGCPGGWSRGCPWRYDGLFLALFRL